MKRSAFILIILASMLLLITSCSESSKEKDAIVKNYIEWLSKEQEEPRPLAIYLGKSVAECTLDKIYDELSKESKSNLKNAKDFSNSDDIFTDGDAEIYDDASQECSDSLYEDVDVEAESALYFSGELAVKLLREEKKISNFSGIDREALSRFNSATEYFEGPLSKRNSGNQVGVLVAKKDQMVLQGNDPDDGSCYFLELRTGDDPRYGSDKANSKGVCPTKPSGPGAIEYTSDRGDGWKES